LEGASKFEILHNLNSEVAKGHVLRLEAMITIPELCDNTELIVSAELLPTATYSELSYLDLRFFCFFLVLFGD
jgi:hypothetical protein